MTHFTKRFDFRRHFVTNHAKSLSRLLSRCNLGQSTPITLLSSHQKTRKETLTKGKDKLNVMHKQLLSIECKEGVLCKLKQIKVHSSTALAAFTGLHVQKHRQRSPFTSCTELSFQFFSNVFFFRTKKKSNGSFENQRWVDLKACQIFFNRVLDSAE